MKTLPLMAAALMLSTSIAVAEETKSSSFYDANGHFAGSTVIHGDGTSSVYNARGNFTGSTIRHGNSTSVYGTHGNFQGSFSSPRR
jgi:hypothetical protein